MFARMYTLIHTPFFLLHAAGPEIWEKACVAFAEQLFARGDYHKVCPHSTPCVPFSCRSRHCSFLRLCPVLCFSPTVVGVPHITHGQHVDGRGNQRKSGEREEQGKALFDSCGGCGGDMDCR